MVPDKSGEPLLERRKQDSPCVWVALQDKDLRYLRRMFVHGEIVLVGEEEVLEAEEAEDFGDHSSYSESLPEEEEESLWEEEVENGGEGSVTV